MSSGTSLLKKRSSKIVFVICLYLCVIIATHLVIVPGKTLFPLSTSSKFFG